MNLNDLKKNWNQLGREDPYWAILTDPDKKGNKWEEESFFESGRLRTDRVAKKLKRIKPGFSFGSALDFGCGVGRLTQGLANHFEKAVGVDIAASMIKLAKEKNKKGNCTYFLNEKNDLALVQTAEFDFIFSEITLQHMEPKYAKNYIVEFLRLLRPSGVAMFQIPSKPDMETRIYHSFLFKLKRKILKVFKSDSQDNEAPVMEMYWIPINEMITFLIENGGQILEVKKNNAAGESWDSYTYLVAKTPEA